MFCGGFLIQEELKEESRKEASMEQKNLNPKIMTEKKKNKKDKKSEISSEKKTKELKSEDSKQDVETIKPVEYSDDQYFAKFVNQIMKKGKKTIARKIIYGALDLIRQKTKKEPLEVLHSAIENTSPLLEVKSKRVGGATYQVPIEVKKERRLTLSMRWIITGAKNKKGHSMKERLALEIIDAANNTGWAVKKKSDTHKMAEANRAFAHFAW